MKSRTWVFLLFVNRFVINVRGVSKLHQLFGIIDVDIIIIIIIIIISLS